MGGVYVLGMLGVPGTAEHNLNNLLQFTWNPGRIGEDLQLRRGVQLGLEVAALLFLLFFGERSPIGGHLGAIRELLPIRGGARPGAQRHLDGDEPVVEIKQEMVEVGDLLGRLDGVEGFLNLDLNLNQAVESRL